MSKDEVHKTEKRYHDQHKSFLPVLSPGDQVILQHPKTGLWDTQAEIFSIRPDGLSFVVKSEGREFLRSRKMIRSLPSHPSSSPDVLHSPPRASFLLHPIHNSDVSTASICQISNSQIIPSQHQLQPGEIDSLPGRYSCLLYTSPSPRDS